jgi:hypothetical protein
MEAIHHNFLKPLDSQHRNITRVQWSARCRNFQHNGLIVPDCKPRGIRLHSGRYQIFCVAVGLERGPLSVVRINEELSERKVAAPV